MTREPKMPMRPEDLPQQRIHEVVELPERPAEFNFDVGYGCSPEGGLPKAGIRSATFLCQVEWAWSPMNNRVDAYYLHRGRSEWLLCSKYWDDNWGKWEHIGIGTVHRRGVNQEKAAALLLLEFWKYDAQNSDVDCYHWINETGYLSVAELSAIASEVWE
jgi:hypothetical protein